MAAEAPCRVEEVEADVVVPVEVASDKREWAARTLRPKIHRHLDRFLVELRTTPLETDERERVYTRDELERAATDDPWWNAAQREMVRTGYMHNHMRMYWGKRILGWTNTPEYAYRTALYLNDRYFLDGRDCSSYANVGWLFGLHDRAWGERDVYGKVRIMTRGGLERKTDPAAYVDKVERLVMRAGGAG